MFFNSPCTWLNDWWEEESEVYVCLYVCTRGNIIHVQTGNLHLSWRGRLGPFQHQQAWWPTDLLHTYIHTYIHRHPSKWSSISTSSIQMIIDINIIIFDDATSSFFLRFFSLTHFSSHIAGNISTGLHHHSMYDAYKPTYLHTSGRESEFSHPARAGAAVPMATNPNTPAKPVLYPSDTYVRVEWALIDWKMMIERGKREEETAYIQATWSL